MNFHRGTNGDWVSDSIVKGHRTPVFTQTDFVIQLQNDPQNPEALMLAAQSALFTGKLDDAIDDVRILHTLPHGKFAFGHFIAARAYEAQSRNAEAAIEYELFLKEAPDSPNAPRAKSALERLKSLP